jgi:hypothetical protein
LRKTRTDEILYFVGAYNFYRREVSMSDILKVEVGDKFESEEEKTLLEVIKIWFNFNEVYQRWETSVRWQVVDKSWSMRQVTEKAVDFVKRLKEGGYVCLNKFEEFSSDVPTVSSSSQTVTDYNPVFKGIKLQCIEDFKKNAAKYGLDPSDLGRQITLNPRKPKYFRIVGAKPKNWKLPILIRGKRGGIYKITAERARAGLV